MAKRALITRITGQDGSYLVELLLDKCIDACEAGTDHIDVWGTGAASRKFVHVDDAAKGIVLATERYEGAEPVNLGVGREITIRDLVETIVKAVGFHGEIRSDPSKPDGQPRQVLNTSWARDCFGFTARTSFEDCLRRTIQWNRSLVPA